MWQHNLPTGDRSGLSGERLQVARRRFSRPKVEKGLELGFSHLNGDGASTEAWELSYVRRQYFHIRPRRALFWDIGLGLCHLDDKVPEQATHTNFIEHAGAGIVVASGGSSAWTVQYRFTHVSNAGREDPNIGLNCSGLSVGWTTFF